MINKENNSPNNTPGDTGETLSQDSSDGRRVLCLGYIQRPRGVKGELRLVQKGRLLNEFKKGAKLDVFSARGVKDGFLVDPVCLEQVKFAFLQKLTDEASSIKLENADSPDQAMRFKGHYLGLYLDEAIERFGGADEPYLFEYLGLLGETVDGEAVGELVRLEEYGPQEWLVFQKDRMEIMVPRNDYFVVQMDVKSRKAVLQNINELDYEPLHNKKTSA